MSPEMRRLVQVIDECRLRLGPISSAVYNSVIGHDRPVHQIAADVRGLFEDFDPVPNLVDQAAVQITAIMADPALTDEGKRQKIAPIAAAARTAATAAVQSMTTRRDRVLSALRQMVRLPRPTPVDAVQVAEIGRLHEGWKLVLDALPADEVPTRLEQFAAEAARRGDALELWAISTDDWPLRYCESRGLAARAPHVSSMIAEAVRPSLGETSSEAAELLAVLESERGIEAAVHVASHLVDWMLREMPRAAA